MALEQRNYDPANMYGAVDSLGATAYTGAVTMASTLAVTGAQTFTGAATFGSTVDMSAGMVKMKQNVLASSGNTTMTSAMTGSVMLLDGAGTDFALPAIGTGDVGMFFDFVATIISTSQTITAQAADLLTGSIVIASQSAGLEIDAFVPDVTDDLIISLDGTTTGGVTVGSWCRLTAISATRWFVQGLFIGSGTLATPFS